LKGARITNGEEDRRFTEPVLVTISLEGF